MRRMASADKLIERIKIGANLRAAREAASLSLRELEAESGISHSRIAKIEKAEVDPQLSTIIILAEALSIEVSKLFK